MNESVPDTHLDLLQGPIYVQLASYMKSGAIQVNPVWCSYDGSHVWVEVRGMVDEITEEGADEHIDDLAELYLNQRPYPFRQDGEVRVIYKILPQRVQAITMS